MKTTIIATALTVFIVIPWVVGTALIAEHFTGKFGEIVKSSDYCK